MVLRTEDDRRNHSTFNPRNTKPGIVYCNAVDENYALFYLVVPPGLLNREQKTLKGSAHKKIVCRVNDNLPQITQAFTEHFSKFQGRITHSSSVEGSVRMKRTAMSSKSSGGGSRVPPAAIFFAKNCNGQRKFWTEEETDACGPHSVG